MIEYSGFLKHFNDALLSKDKTHFYDGITEIEWHAGRFFKLPIPFETCLKRIKLLNLKHKHVSIIFSNQYICRSEKGLAVLKILNSVKGNGVIITNIDFAKYIKKNFPRIKIILSITDYNRKIRQYTRKYLETFCDYIVPYYWERWENLYHHNKYILLSNTICPFQCRQYEKDFRSCCKDQLEIRNENFDSLVIPPDDVHCRSMRKFFENKKKLYSDYKDRNMIGSLFIENELQKIQELGFNLKEDTYGRGHGDLKHDIRKI